MRAWSIAFGPVSTTTGKVANIAKRIFAFLFGLALLPFTLAGMALRASSTSHRNAFNAPAEEEEEKFYSTTSPPVESEEAFEVETQDALLQKVRTFTEGYAQGPTLVGMLQRILCPFENELHTRVEQNAHEYAIKIQTEDAPWAEFKSAKSRIPYNFHLEPREGCYHFKVVKGDALTLDLGGSLLFQKVNPARQTAIINSFNWTQRMGALAVGIDLPQTARNSLERASETIQCLGLRFLYENEMPLIKAESAKLSKKDQENQAWIQGDIADKLKNRGAREFAHSGIAFGEMLVGDDSKGLRNGGEGAHILKCFNPVGSAKGEGKNPGRIQWYDRAHVPIERDPF